MVFGSYCTQVMADMGADIIKVEPPEGDITRVISPGPIREMGGIFANLNRGKRSVTLDLRDERGKDALRALIGTADVFIHSMRAKAIRDLGFDYEAVSTLRSDIVYVNCYGYGRGGPYRDLPAYDDTMQAECGMVHLQGLMTGEPGFAATIVADKVSGLTALYATMMALFHRQRTGQGQEVEVGMFEAMASFMLIEHASGKLFEPPLGPAHYHRVASPSRRPYRTRDGHIVALVYNDKHWNAFVGELQPEWATAEIATVAQRATQIERVYALLAETFAQRTTAEWLELLNRLEIPAAPLRSTDELFDDPHLDSVDFFKTVTADFGTMRLPGPPVTLSRSPGRVAGPPPRLGQHTEEVLAEIGFAPRRDQPEASEGDRSCA